MQSRGERRASRIDGGVQPKAQHLLTIASQQHPAPTSVHGTRAPTLMRTAFTSRDGLTSMASTDVITMLCPSICRTGAHAVRSHRGRVGEAANRRHCKETHKEGW